MMNERVESLARILEGEIGIQDAMLDRLRTQQEIVISCRFEDLEQNLEDLARIQREGRELGDRRIQTVRDLARSMMPFSDPITLGALVEGLDGPEAERIGVLREDLIARARLIRKTSRQNMLLIRQSLDLNRELMTALSGGRAQKPVEAATYGSGGQAEASTGRALVDTRI